MISILRREVLDRLLILNEHQLRQVLTEYLLHYNAARAHRALDRLAPIKLAPSDRSRSTLLSTGSAGTQLKSSVSRLKSSTYIRLVS